MTVVLTTLIDTLHKDGWPQKAGAERASWSQSAVSKHAHEKLTGREKCDRKKVYNISNEMTAALRGLSSKVNSRTVSSFTRRVLRPESVHREPPGTDVSRKWALSVSFIVSSRS